MYRQIQIVCPAKIVTGGPESLHQLAQTFSQLGVQTEMVYYPFSVKSETPSEYQKYEVQVGLLHDEIGTLVIFPEILCMDALKIRKADAAIWWLSVDNFLERKYYSYRDKARYCLAVLKGNRPIFPKFSLKNLIHFSKSEYDREFLKSLSLPFHQISGPISRIYTEGKINENQIRRNIILYNPNKGFQTTQKLISKFPQYIFISLKEMNTLSLLKIYREAKIYIDFGHHPGKERMPREAAANGCCVITGMKGSAANEVDIPIPKRYKINEDDLLFFEKFYSLTEFIFNEFDHARNDFEHYRSEVKAELEKHISDVQKVIKNLNIRTQ